MKKLITIILFIQFISCDLVENKNILDKALMKEIEKMREIYPKIEDKDTRLEYVDFTDEREVKFVYTVINDDVVQDFERQVLTPILLNEVKTNRLFKNWRENKVTWIYDYIDNDGYPITSNIRITPDQYNMNRIYASIETNKGTIKTELFFEKTPITVANFISLSDGSNKNVSDEYKNKKYYNGLIFHRVISNFMIQGGDPTGSGSGSPGYKFKDEIVEDLKHDSKGILSMANAGPKTNGSQFFITHKETPWLDGLHTVFGKTVEGLDVIDKISQGDSILNIEIIRTGSKAKRFNASKIFSNHFKDEEKLKLAREKEKENTLKETSKRHDKLKGKAEETESGLKYIITEKGNGLKVNENKVILTHYAVYYEDGQLLDTSVLEIAEVFDMVNIQRKNANGYTPIEARVGPKDMMISGFKEGLKLLSVGDKAILYIPYYLAYGEMENRGIPAKSNLIFEVEIVDQL